MEGTLVYNPFNEDCLALVMSTTKEGALFTSTPHEFIYLEQAGPKCIPLGKNHLTELYAKELLLESHGDFTDEARRVLDVAWAKNLEQFEGKKIPRIPLHAYVLVQGQFRGKTDYGLGMVEYAPVPHPSYYTAYEDLYVVRLTGGPLVQVRWWQLSEIPVTNEEANLNPLGVLRHMALVDANTRKF